MKSILLAVLFFFVPKLAISQIIKPTRYNLDSLHFPTTKDDYKYIRIVENYKNQPDLFLFTEYYRSKTVSMKAISKKKEEAKFEGPRIDYYENGNIKQESNYVDNKLSGKQIDWYENNVKKSEKEIVWDSKAKDYNKKTLQFWNKDGQQTVIDGNGDYEERDDHFFTSGKLKNGFKDGIWEGNDKKRGYTFSENYVNQKLVSGVSIDKEKITHNYIVVELKPEPKKGMDDFIRHISKTYKSPNVQGLKGKIYIKFAVETDGSVTDIKILKDIGYGTGLEAIRTVGSYKGWVPGEIRGIKIRTTFSLPISIQTINGKYQNQEPTFESEMIRNTNRNW
jgi:antitoxin component YwqK of YwqJK toxin-antitoxin module